MLRLGLPVMADRGLKHGMRSALVDGMQSFNVLLDNRNRVEAGLVAIAKRCIRKGIGELVWSWGRPVVARERIPHPEFGWDVECHGNVARIALTIEGGTPSYSGWIFVSALSHIDGQTIIRNLPGQQAPTSYRDANPKCDHCHASRRRNETYVLRHEDGRYVQVGSSCIRDFLGSDAAEKLAASASILADVASLASDGEQSYGSVALVEYLTFVAWAVRTLGWVSRTAARDREDTRATADIAMQVLVDARARSAFKANPSAEDETLAKAAEAWALALSDEAVSSQTSDYLYNVRAVALTGLVVYKTMGIAASTIVAYQKSLAREVESQVADIHVGTIGKRETFVATLNFVTGYETAYGYTTGYTTVLKFRTAEGAVLVWKASGLAEVGRSDVGKTYKVVGTVKEHSEYKGAKQTIVQRCKLAPV